MGFSYFRISLRTNSQQYKKNFVLELFCKSYSYMYEKYFTMIQIINKTDLGIGQCHVISTFHKRNNGIGKSLTQID